MIHALLRGIDRLVSVPAASAHCDIPCKIYDPSAAQIAALSVIRFMDLASSGAITSSNRSVMPIPTSMRWSTASCWLVLSANKASNATRARSC